jgi:hypothetical protein
MSACQGGSASGTQKLRFATGPGTSACSGKPPASHAALAIVVPGRAADAVTLVPRTRATQVDLPQQAQAWPAAGGLRGRRARASCIRRINRRSCAGIAGRPGGRWGECRLSNRRCQRGKVSGVTNRWRRRCWGSSRVSADRASRDRARCMPRPGQRAGHRRAPVPAARRCPGFYRPPWAPWSRWPGSSRNVNVREGRAAKAHRGVASQRRGLPASVAGLRLRNVRDAGGPVETHQA